MTSSNDDGGLARAIGSVVIQSALTDQTLRAILVELWDSYSAYPAVEGQSAEWLRWAIRTGLEETIVLYLDPERGNLLRLLEQLAELSTRRNQVVHGSWSTPRADEATPRAWPGSIEDDGSPVFRCTRSRLRQVSAIEQFVSVRDVERLADAFRATWMGLEENWGRMRHYGDSSEAWSAFGRRSDF